MRMHRDRRPRLSVMHLVPNVLTLAALCAGLTAIRLAFMGQFDRAAALILLAAVLDGLDGRLARRMRTESAIGAELDSLCDLVDFGVAPVLVLHLWAFGGAGGMGWIAALVYAAACALRLARFNISSREGVAATGFTGVPSPAGAMLVLLPLFVANLSPAAMAPGPVVALWIVIVAGLLASRLPTPALPPVRIQPDQARLLLLVAVALGAALLTYPWLTLVSLDIGYLLLLSRGWLHFRGQKAGKDG